MLISVPKFYISNKYNFLAQFLSVICDQLWLRKYRGCFQTTQYTARIICACFCSIYIIILIDSMKDTCVKLIEHHGVIEDEILFNQYPFLNSADFASLQDDSPIENIQDQDSITPQTQSNSQPHGSPQNLLVKEENEEVHQHLRKTKRIKKVSDHEESSEIFSSTSYTQRRRRSRKFKEEKPKPYPTKNFLPNFKGPHLEFLQKYLQNNQGLTKSEFNQIDIIYQLQHKNGISLEDYQRLYRMKEFSKAFEAMFECQYLHRELLLSRSILATKKTHMRKLYVFEEAFRSQKFDKINY